MKDTTTGQGISDELKRGLVKFNLSDNKRCGLTTDGAPAMTGKHNGLGSLMLKLVPHDVIVHPCPPAGLQPHVQAAMTSPAHKKKTNLAIRGILHASTCATVRNLHRALYQNTPCRPHRVCSVSRMHGAGYARSHMCSRGESLGSRGLFFFYARVTSWLPARVVRGPAGGCHDTLLC